MSITPAHRSDWSGLTTDSPTARVAILGVPFDGAVSFRPGAALAPGRIRHFSHHVAPITEDGQVLRDFAVRDYGDVERDLDWVRYFQTVEDRARQALQHPFTLFLGGDHSVGIPLMRAFDSMGGAFGVLHIDAHVDLADSYEGHRWSHACTERRALELPGLQPEHMCFCGIRSWLAEELDFIAAHPGICVHTAKAMYQRGMDAVATEVIAQLQHLDRIYLTLDIDCLDPAYAPGTGTPEAGGLTSRELLDLLERVFAALPIRAMDIVEVAPPLDTSDITSIAALKVIYEVFGWLGTSVSTP
jgi:agmatinase